MQRSKSVQPFFVPLVRSGTVYAPAKKFGIGELGTAEVYEVPELVLCARVDAVAAIVGFTVRAAAVAAVVGFIVRAAVAAIDQIAEGSDGGREQFPLRWRRGGEERAIWHVDVNFEATWNASPVEVVISRDTAINMPLNSIIIYYR